MKTPYTDTIKRLAPEHDPRHVEAYMRINRPTLDALDATTFAAEVRIGIFCIEAAGTTDAERLAKSFGL